MCVPVRVHWYKYRSRVQIPPRSIGRKPKWRVEKVAETKIRVETLNQGNRADLRRIASGYIGSTCSCLGIDSDDVLSRAVKCMNESRDVRYAREEARRLVEFERGKWIENASQTDPEVVKLRELFEANDKQQRELRSKENELRQKIAVRKTAIETEWNGSEVHTKVLKEAQDKLAKDLKEIDARQLSKVKVDNLEQDMRMLFNDFQEKLAMAKTVPEASKILNVLKSTLDKTTTNYIKKQEVARTKLE